MLPLISLCFLLLVNFHFLDGVKPSPIDSINSEADSDWFQDQPVNADFSSNLIDLGNSNSSHLMQEPVKRV